MNLVVWTLLNIITIFTQWERIAATMQYILVALSTSKHYNVTFNILILGVVPLPHVKYI